MRYLGIDYGSKRIGIALSDVEGQLAFPADEIANTGLKKVLEKITRLASKEKVGVIVLGVPMPFGGKPSDQTRAVEKFGADLKKAVQLPVEYENEVLSTKMAEREGATADTVNSSSAAIILQSYLDKINKR